MISAKKLKEIFRWLGVMVESHSFEFLDPMDNSNDPEINEEKVVL